MKKENQIKLFIALNIVFFILSVITDVLYMNLHQPYIFKTLASVTFVVWSLINLTLMFVFKNTINKKFMIFMFIGQIFACIGDILLIDFFIIGACFFAISHIFFFVSYFFLQKFKWQDLIYIVTTIIFSIAFILISKVDLGSLAILVFIYAIVISTMLGKSLTLFKGSKIIASVIFIGSLMFYLSDLFLMLNIFGNVSFNADAFCLIFYYPAEFVLASSVGVVGLISSKNNNDNNK